MTSAMTVMVANAFTYGKPTIISICKFVVNLKEKKVNRDKKVKAKMTVIMCVNVVVMVKVLGSDVCDYFKQRSSTNNNKMSKKILFIF